MTRNKRLFITGLAFSAMLVASTLPAQALVVSGTLGWTGTGVVAFSTDAGAPGTNFIDFCPINAGTPTPGGPAAGCPVGTPGLGQTNVTTTLGTFSGFDPPGGPGTIRDITDNAAAPAPYTFVALGANNIPGFFDFPDPWLYTLTTLDPQVCAPSAAVVCTGYFQLIQTGTNVAVNMSGSGFINAAGDLTGFTWLLTGNFAGTTIAQVIAAAASPNGVFSPSWSGTLVTTGQIPEPMTLLTLGTGSALLAYRRRRAAKNKAATI